MKKPTVGQAVIVYDRYRFAIPLTAEVVSLSTHNDGVEVKLRQSNNANTLSDVMYGYHADN